MQPAINRIPYRKIIFIGILVVIAMVSCVTVYDTIGNRNFADKYNPNKTGLNPQYKLYNKAPGKFELYYRFFPAEFAFAVIDEDSIPKAKARIFFRVTKDYNSIEILDSLSKTITFKGKPRPQFLGYLPIHLQNEGSYALEVFLVDMISKRMVSEVIDFELTKKGNELNYMLLSDMGNPLFRNYFRINDSVRLKTHAYSQKNINVNYFRLHKTIPISPDTPTEIYLDPWKIDSTFTIPNPDTALLCFDNEGVYAFSGSDQLRGATYLCVDDHFPYLKTPDKLLAALAYLNTEKEMNAFFEMESAKNAVDTFWLKATNDVDKARELIRIYYNRVQLANYYFTDFKEGWLSDRGMLYIVCGAPANIQKSEDGEYWIYGKGATDEMKFYFYKDKHPVFGQTYILDRSDLYTRIWFNAVATWREGRAFSLNP